MVIFFWVSHQPGSSLDLPEIPHIDKVFHAGAYSVLGIALGLWGCWHRPRPFPKTVGLTVGILYGILDEIHQSFIPLREAGWADAVADAVGITFGVFLAYAIAAKWVKTEIG
jgi:VanZ family protein